MTGGVTRLRPPRADEAEVLQAWRSEAASPYDDWSISGSPTALDERLPRLDGIGHLVVVDAEDRLLGAVQWHPVRYGPTRGSLAMNIGISLHPDFQGLGHGARAQRQLAEHLFATLGVHRVEAGTDVDNVAEQRALERAGFIREGVVRGAQWRGGAFHDLVVYARLATDAADRAD